ncbi:Imm41 family immunity protein [Cohnella suwonensis]|uniref:Imm41 family immunity protein n=1 Tax=Cohnella suwonensis TaxID=696072 RepID=A0ABW0M3X1_9BACL
MQEDEILESNCKLVEGTFLYNLVEEATFDQKSFWVYYNASIEIVKKSIHKPLDRELTRKLQGTFKRILECFYYHSVESDQYRITNFPYEDINYYYERLSFMIDGYFNNFVMDESQFGDFIKNPKFSELYD